MYIQVSHGVRNGVIKLETKLKLVSVFFHCFYGRLELLMGINFDVTSFLKSTFNQRGPVSKNLNNRDKRNICQCVSLKSLLRSRPSYACLWEVRFSSAFYRRNLTFFFREYSFEFMLHRKEKSQLTWRFSRGRKKTYINMLPQRV